MAQVGYARVSSVGQSLELQLEKLKHCDKIYREQRSATRKRPRLAACLEYVPEGDTLVVTRLDRLVRSALHLCQIAEELRRGVVFGRSKHLTRPQIAALRARREQGVLICTLMYDYRISKATVYRYLHEDGAAAGA